MSCTPAQSPSRPCTINVQAFLGCPTHLFVRAYASLHLLALYVAAVVALPPVRALLPALPKHVVQALKAMGLWHPDVAAGLLPLLGLVLLVRGNLAGYWWRNAAC